MYKRKTPSTYLPCGAFCWWGVRDLQLLSVCRILGYCDCSMARFGPEDGRGQVLAPVELELFLFVWIEDVDHVVAGLERRGTFLQEGIIAAHQVTSHIGHWRQFAIHLKCSITHDYLRFVLTDHNERGTMVLYHIKFASVKYDILL